MGCNRCGKGKKAARKVAPARAAAAEAETRRAAAKAARAEGLRRMGARPPSQPKAQQPQRDNARAVPYTIVRGDTMADIGRRFGMTTQEIAKYDGGTGVPNLARIRSRNIHVLSPGEVILVPRKSN